MGSVSSTFWFLVKLLRRTKGLEQLFFWFLIFFFYGEVAGLKNNIVIPSAHFLAIDKLQDLITKDRISYILITQQPGFIPNSSSCQKRMFESPLSN